MANKGSDRVTLTLYRSTVEMLRSKKKGMETWDDLMRRLGKKRRCGIECIICGAFVQTTDVNVSPSELAKRNGWEKMYSGRVYLNRDGVKTKVELGFICDKCVEAEDTKALELEAKAKPGERITLNESRGSSS